MGMKGKDRDEGKVNSFVQYLKKKTSKFKQHSSNHIELIRTAG